MLCCCFFVLVFSFLNFSVSFYEVLTVFLYFSNAHLLFGICSFLPGTLVSFHFFFKEKKNEEKELGHLDSVSHTAPVTATATVSGVARATGLVWGCELGEGTWQLL